MPARFDPDGRRIELSVADLLDVSTARSLGFANRGGYERMWLGQAIHSSYQEKALGDDPSYRREVACRATFEHRGWEVTVHGRADGLRRDGDGTLVVEEIKSVRRGAELAPTVRELYERQALLYAWMLGRSEGEPVRPELVLIEIGTDRAMREPVEGDPEALETAVRRRVDRLLRRHEAERAAHEVRRQAAGRLAFPYEALRPGQQEIVDAVELALDQREHLLVEATTGIGKTVAALYPALRHALAHDKKLYVLTAKTLQQEMASEVLRLLDTEGAFGSLRLKAKAKMCANDQVLCHEEYCPYARDYYSKLQGSKIVDRLARESDLLDPERIFEAARAQEVCPFEVSLELGRRVEVVVCDYNYAFDPYVALSGFHAEEDLSDTILVVDEIHNLVDRGRGYYSPELSAGAARRAGTAMGNRGAPVHRDIERACLALAELVEETVAHALYLDELPRDGSELAVETPLPEDELWMLRRDFDAAFVDYLEHQKQTKTLAAEDPFVELYFDFLRFLNGLALAEGDAFSQCVELRGGDGAYLRVLCKDPSRFLGAVIDRTHTTIGLSATLSPPEFYRDLLGFDPARTGELAVADPFPPEHRRVVIDPAVATTYRERPANYAKIGERLSAFADAVPGNCLALFPSYRFLAEVSASLAPAGKRVLIQSPGSGDAERQEILAALRNALFGDVLLLAVAGGVFAEGVDYPGDTLKAVAVVGPCLPALTLEQQLLKEYYEDRFARGFEYAFVVPGMTRVVQAAGRLIRSAEDTGVIALLDHRFLRNPYKRHLPEDWLPAEGPKGLTGEPARAAAEFFRGVLAEAAEG